MNFQLEYQEKKTKTQKNLNEKDITTNAIKYKKS